MSTNIFTLCSFEGLTWMFSEPWPKPNKYHDYHVLKTKTVSLVLQCAVQNSQLTSNDKTNARWRTKTHISLRLPGPRNANIPAYAYRTLARSILSMLLMEWIRPTTWDIYTPCKYWDKLNINGLAGFLPSTVAPTKILVWFRILVGFQETKYNKLSGWDYVHTPHTLTVWLDA